MITDILRLQSSKSKELKSTAQDVFWVMLAQLYKAHQVDYPIPEFAEALRTRDFDRCLDLADTLSSQKYTTAHEHYVKNQFAYLFKKQTLPSKHNAEEKAVSKFFASEASMARVNARFLAWDLDVDFGTSETKQRYNLLLRRMRSWICRTIGREPDLHEVFRSVGFGPGASLGVNGKATNGKRKLTPRGRWTVSPRAFTYLAGAVHENLWLRRKFSPDPDGHPLHSDGYWVKALKSKCRFVRYNKITFVPKTAKTKRTIAVEPLGNSLLQKGAGEVLTLRLKRVGIDLSTQTVNQEFARIGSLEDCSRPLATIDLSAASDSVALQVVKRLFPDAWFELLNSIRSENFILNGELHRYQKFSSMGNGTTFPIETLIFTAACVASGAGCPGKDFTVYGDDIIVPTHCVRTLLRLLRIMGFRTNNDKTFISGPFRESCGEDWFGGIAVRPLVLDYTLKSVTDVYKFLNQTRSRPLWEDFFEPIRNFVLRLLPRRLHLFRPFAGPPDSAIEVEFDVFLASQYATWNKRLQCWSWLEIQRSSVEDTWFEPVRGWFEEPPDFVKWYGTHTLTGGGTTSRSPTNRPAEFPCWFDLRNTTRTEVVRKDGSGATENWLPSGVVRLKPRKSWSAQLIHRAISIYLA